MVKISWQNLENELSTFLGINNNPIEKAERLESYCIFNFLKTHFKTFISVQDVLNKEKKEQPLVQDVNNSVNTTYIKATFFLFILSPHL